MTFRSLIDVCAAPAASCGVAVLCLFAGAVRADTGAGLDLNGGWDFRFEEGKSLEEVSPVGFAATDRMAVPACWDVAPKYLCKRGTALYRRTFALAEAVPAAWLVVDGMGLRGAFTLDGRSIGSSVMPWSRFELATGPLEAGRHVLEVALDNIPSMKRARLVNEYYDFYLHGGFYHGVSLAFDNRRLLVRTRDYRTGTVEVEVANEVKAKGEGEQRTLVFDGTNEVKVAFRDGKATVKVPDFRLWTPEHPNLHTVALKQSNNPNNPNNRTILSTHFGIRQVEARDRRLWLNGEVLYLRGFNRHESHPEFGAATPEALMVHDLELVKSLGGNFIRGAHYQQSQRFLDYCDEMGVLVWEESLGWGNTVEHLRDPEFRRLQKEQTRRMVRTSFNHPSVIVFAFLNENFSYDEAAKSIVGELVDVVKAEDSGRLVTFAVRYFDKDIANDKTDFIAFNLYPGWIHGYPPGPPDVLKGKMDDLFSRIVARYRGLYPEKPLFTSEIGTLAIYGARDESAAQQSEEFQAEYVTDAIERVFADPELCGVAIWQFADSRSFNRGGGNTRNKPMAMNLAGLYDGYRRPKLATRAVREAFAKPAAGERPWQKDEVKR